MSKYCVFRQRLFYVGFIVYSFVLWGGVIMGDVCRVIWLCVILNMVRNGVWILICWLE